MINRNKQNGMSILGAIVFAAVVILVLSYFRISLKSIVESPSGQENIDYVGGGLKTFWVNHLQEPASNFWNYFTLKINQDGVDYNKSSTQKNE